MKRYRMALPSTQSDDSTGQTEDTLAEDLYDRFDRATGYLMKCFGSAEYSLVHAALRNHAYTIVVHAHMYFLHDMPAISNILIMTYSDTPTEVWPPSLIYIMIFHS